MVGRNPQVVCRAPRTLVNVVIARDEDPQIEWIGYGALLFVRIGGTDAMPAH